MESTLQNIVEPEILTASCYFWKPGCNASSRRNNEKRRQSEVGRFFEAIGLSVAFAGDRVTGESEEILAEFEYSETCKNVYKSLSVCRKVKGEWKKSNITALRRLYNGKV